MQNIPTEDLINELERRVDCSKRRGVRTILITLTAPSFIFANLLYYQFLFICFYYMPNVHNK